VNLLKHQEDADGLRAAPEVKYLAVIKDGHEDRRPLESLPHPFRPTKWQPSELRPAYCRTFVLIAYYRVARLRRRPLDDMHRAVLGWGRGRCRETSPAQTRVRMDKRDYQTAPSRWAVSLKLRTIHRPAVITSREIEAFSAPRKANGRDALASDSAWPMTPPWVNAATR
jgi:hypothetical protein